MRRSSPTMALLPVVIAMTAMFAGMSCSRQARVIWQQQFSSGLGDAAVSVAVDGNDIIIGANCRDTGTELYDSAWELLRYDANGKLLWQKRYERGPIDRMAAVAVLPDHDIIAVGSTFPRAGGYPSKLLLSRFSPEGVLRWQKEYAFAANTLGAALTVDSSGRITVCGSVTSDSFFNPRCDVLIARFDAEGNAIDHETLDFGADEYGVDLFCLRERRNTTTTVAGARVRLPASTDSLSDRDIVIAGLGPEGTVLWREYYASGGYGASGRNSVVRVAGNSAAVSSYTFGGYEVHLLEYGSRWGRSELLRNTRYPGDSNATCLGLTADQGGHVLGVGSAGPEEHQHLLGWRYFRGKFFNFLPAEGYVPGDYDRANAIALDAAGNAIVVGTSGTGKDAGVLTLKVALPRYKPPPDLWLPNMYR
jgi:hypothetical protein